MAKDLAAELDLSDDTIRRDLRELAADEKLQRVHGGALPASPAVIVESMTPDAQVRALRRAGVDVVGAG